MNHSQKECFSPQAQKAFTPFFLLSSTPSGRYGKLASPLLQVTRWHNFTIANIPQKEHNRNIDWKSILTTAALSAATVAVQAAAQTLSRTS